MALKEYLFTFLAGSLLPLVLGSCLNPSIGETLSSNASLTDLSCSGGALMPVFSPDRMNYRVSVYHDTASVVINGVCSDVKASISANNGRAQVLALGSNTISITVTAENGIDTKTYQVDVQRSADKYSRLIGELKYVPPGRYQRDAGSANVTAITQAFWMASGELTRNQFVSVMQSDPSDSNRSTGGNDPAQCTSWYQAIAFCNKLSLLEGLSPVYSVSSVSNWSSLAFADIPTVTDANWESTTADWSKNGFRLASEAEWMWAAMGAPLDGRDGQTNTSAYLDPFAGADAAALALNYAVYSDNSGPSDSASETRKTRPTGSKLPNGLGIFDLSGNVWEWCWDCYASFPAGELSDYRGPASGSVRVNHGGSFLTAVNALAPTARGASAPKTQNNGMGIRVVRY